MAAAVAIPSTCSEYLGPPVCLANCELCATRYNQQIRKAYGKNTKSKGIVNNDNNLESPQGKLKN